jgi:hypothetical protein
MIIDVIDMEDPNLGSNRREWLDYLGASSVKIEMYGQSNGIGQMISDITRRAGLGRLQTLRIWSHGAPGMQNVSAGASGSGAVHWASLSLTNLPQVMDTLAQLRQYFAPHAHVELRGCNVAQGPQGEQFLIELARIWGVPVQGGTIVQTTGRWAGVVVEAQPNGGLSCTSGVAVGTRA